MASSAGSRSGAQGDSKKGKATNAQPRRRSNRSQSSFAALLELAILTFWGRVILVLLIAAALTAINLLVSGNRFDLFFQMTGVELILLTVIFWIRFMVRKN
jgi:hypothetical protein